MPDLAYEKLRKAFLPGHHWKILGLQLERTRREADSVQEAMGSLQRSQYHDLYAFVEL